MMFATNTEERPGSRHTAGGRPGSRLPTGNTRSSEMGLGSTEPPAGAKGLDDEDDNYSDDDFEP